MQKPQYRKPVRSLHTLGLSNDAADVNAFYKRGEPALTWAADYGTPSVIKVLLAHGARVDARDRQGCTALHYAAFNGRVKNARLLIAAHANVNAKEGDGHTPLMQDQSARLTKLLLRRGAKVNARSTSGWTALMDALLTGLPEQTALLLAAGADVQARDEERRTPLLFSAAHLNGFSHEMDVAHIKLLLAYGANVNERDGEGKSVLWHTAHRLRYDTRAHEVIALLLESGATATDDEGRHLLAWTKQAGYAEAALLLAAAGAKE